MIVERQAVPLAFDDVSVGVLNQEQLRTLCQIGVLDGGEPAHLEPDASAIDLHLSDEGWRLDATVKQRGAPPDTVRSQLNDIGAVAVDLKSGQILRPGTVYLFRLRESLHLRDHPWLFGEATGKSSVGRIDVLTRLVVDGHPKYEEVPPGYEGELFLEVVSLSFPIVAHSGLALNQLRFFCGPPDACRLPTTIGRRLLLGGGAAGQFDFAGQEHGTLRLDVTPDGRTGFVAFQALPDAPAEVHCRKGANDPTRFFRGCRSEDRTLVLEPNGFYIFRSKERLSLAADVAVTGRAYTEALGEIRIHYAGFAHPLFGRGRADGRSGTPLIFEIRAHSFPVRLRDGEEIAKVVFYSMSRPAPVPSAGPSRPMPTAYAEQELTLSGFFSPWPT